MEKLKPIVLFGSDKLAEVAYAYLTNDAGREIAAFTVNDEFIKSSQLLNKVVTPFEILPEKYSPDDYEMFIAVGSSGKLPNQNRERIFKECKDLGFKMINYVNSNTRIWGNIEIGENVFILGANNIDPYVTIGDNTIIWGANHVGHHSVIGENVFISSGVIVSGSCTIGNNCFLGVNSAVADGISIAPYCFIGMGANIAKNTQEKEVYVGIKAEPKSYLVDERY